MRRSRTRSIRGKKLGRVLGLIVVISSGVAGASRKQPAVTDGGYMQTQTADGKRVALPLEHTDVDAKIAGVVASVDVTQHFHNPYKKPIEAVYVFPLPHKAAIYRMTIKIGKRTIRGVVKRRAQARRMYRRAKRQGRTAALLEQERPNIFTQSIANIMPGDKIEVRLRYVENLEPERGRYTFAFPMVVGPRYVGGGERINTRKGHGWGHDTTRIPDASRITPKLLAKGLRPGNDIDVKLRIDGGAAVRDLKVVTHRASVSHAGAIATVKLDERDSIPNKDFVVRYRLAGKRPEVSVLAHRDKRGGHFMLMIQPKARMQRRDIAPREYVFVVDNSGSMSGFPLAQARALVERCLDEVTSRDRFQIIKFAGRPDQMAPQSLRATKHNVRAALRYIQNMRGGGGTEFLPALRAALGARKDPQRSRIVLFITDGYIGYERQVLQYLRQNAGHANIFALGVGSSVNRFLIDGMARVGGGSPFYLLNSEKAEDVVGRVFATISKPALTDIEIDWGKLDVTRMTPGAVPDLFGERPVVLAGRYRRGGAGTVTVHGRLAGRRFTKRVQVTLPRGRGGAGEAVAYLWARRRIADLMDLHRTIPTRHKALERGVTKLALRYNLMSRFTSFIAIDSRVRNQGGEQRTVDVPVPLPQGVSPKAAPRRAYVGALGGGHGYGRGAGGLVRGSSRTRHRRRRPIRPTLQTHPAKDADEPAPAPVATATRKPATEAAREEKSKGDTTASKQRAKPALAVRYVRVVNGQASVTGLRRQIAQLVRRLRGKLASLRGLRSGRLTLRLSVRGGRVRSVAFVSGSLMQPDVQRELGRLLRRWRLRGVKGGATVVVGLQLR